jgi:class 3 adenylate cyclase/uncharacterized protein YeeX (DUF496 family)
MKKDIAALKIFTRGKSKLQLAVTTFFIILLAVSSIFTLTYTYIETSDAALKSAWQMMKSTNVGISKDVLRYMSMARRAVRAATWSLKDAQNIRDNKEKIFSIMSGQVKAQREIFTMIAGDSSGSVLSVGKIFEDPKYSVNKSKSLPPEVVYRSHYVDNISFPKSEYYAYYNKNFEEIEREVVPANGINYDARTKVWYMEADKNKKNSWTDIRIYSNGEFGTSNAEPVKDNIGNTKIVVSASIALSLSDGISSRLHVGENGIAFLLDDDGKLIAYPDRKKITVCQEKEKGKPAKCEFNKVDQIGNAPLAAAFEKYKVKSDLSNPKNIPVRLNYKDYIATVKRLNHDKREAFDKVYSINENDKKILLKKDLSKEIQETVPDILDSIGYTFNMRFKSEGQEYLASFKSFPESYGKPWNIGVLVPINDFIGALNNTIIKVTIISIIILIVSLIIIIIFAHRILRPLKAIAQDMNRIQNLDIDESVTHKSFFYEISIIADALASMKHGLKAFSKFVPYTLVKQLIVSGKGAELGGEKRPLTMMFSDIAGFTTISESMSTEHLLLHISEYLDSLTTIILEQQGTVDKYIGDCIMCFWGAPNEVKEQEYQSCKTALLCLAKLKEMNIKWEAEGKPALNTRFGISSGEVSVGNMGSSDRMNYTVLGDSVNLASRLEGINKYYGTVIIVGESTYEAVKNQFCFRPIDVVAVKGKNRGVKIYQLLAASSAEPEIAPDQDDLKSQELTGKAFDAYINRNFKLALELYIEITKAFPNDPIGEMYVERCKEYLITPPPADWDGVTHMKTK